MMFETTTSCWRNISNTRVLTSTLSQTILESLIKTSRIVLKSRDEYPDECCEENHNENPFGCGFEFKCFFESRFRVWLRVCITVCLHAERECCFMALEDQLRVDKCDCERMRVQIAHTSVAPNQANTSADSASSTTPLTQTTQLRCGKPRTVFTVAAKKQVELWQLEKCDLRTKAWEAREIQLEALGAKRECLPKLGARLKHDRTDDDAEDERNEGVLRDCVCPQDYANPGVSPLMRPTEREVRRDSCDKVHTTGSANQFASHV